METKFDNLMKSMMGLSIEFNSMSDQIFIIEDQVNLKHVYNFMMILKTMHCHTEKLLQEVGFHLKNMSADKPLMDLCKLCDLKNSTCKHVMFDNEQVSDFEIASTEVIQDRISAFHKKANDYYKDRDKK